MGFAGHAERLQPELPPAATAVEIVSTVQDEAGGAAKGEEG